MNKVLTALAFLITLTVSAQELNCKVTVNSNNVQTSNKKIFTEMEQVFTQFMSNRTWTDDQFSQQERINCNLILTIDPNSSDPSAGHYEASVQILSYRPVYNTNYETVVFNFADRDFSFEYVQSQSMQFNINLFKTNITSLLAYYAYTIIGLDYDTFSELGGTKYYQLANQILINAQNSGYNGWTQFNSVRNRYWLNENLLNGSFDPLRKALYTYHRNGLDIFTEDPNTARNNILSGLRDIQAVNKARPRSIMTISFLDAKAEELTEIFKQGTPAQKRETYTILTRLEPAKTETFKKIME